MQNQFIAVNHKLAYMTSIDYRLLTALRFDRFLENFSWNKLNGHPSPYLLLEYHRDRLLEAIEQHGWKHLRQLVTVDRLKTLCDAAVARVEGNTGPLKIRITLSKGGDWNVTTSSTRSLTADPTGAPFFNPLADNPSYFKPYYTVRLDTQPTPTSLFTRTKTTHRDIYNEARTRSSIPPITDGNTSPLLSDVILYNPEGYITETSIYNVAFYRSSRWVTPQLSTGCLPGVVRRWLLEQNRIRESVDGELTRDSIEENEWVLLFNGVQGCRIARVVLT